MSQEQAVKIPEGKAFDSFLTESLILQNLKNEFGFSVATPIQSEVAGPIFEGRNIFAGAKTGSGKTIAFLAPLAQRLLQNEIKNVLVLAPTRELVLQIDEEAEKLLMGQNQVVPVALYGGVPIEPQALVMKHHKPRLFMATPGRLLDFLTEGLIPFGDFDVVVLDEADRMCDMGFAPQVTDILELCINVKQALLFSATLPPELDKVMKKFCPDPVRIQVDAADQTNASIEHKVLFCDRSHKLRKLASLMKDDAYLGVIFTRTRIGADQVHRELKRVRSDIGILHAGYSMDERERTIRAFKDNKISLLVATDVASRGLDINHIRQVIQFDFPESLDDYIHRSGRSGRAGRSGISVLFVEKDNRNQMRAFEELSEKVTFQPLEISEKRSESEDAGRESSRPRGRRDQGSYENETRQPRGRSPRTKQDRHDGPRTSSRDSANPRDGATRGSHRDAVHGDAARVNSGPRASGSRSADFPGRTLKLEVKKPLLGTAAKTAPQGHFKKKLVSVLRRLFIGD